MAAPKEESSLSLASHSALYLLDDEVSFDLTTRGITQARLQPLRKKPTQGDAEMTREVSTRHFAFAGILQKRQVGVFPRFLGSDSSDSARAFGRGGWRGLLLAKLGK
jgi:hypothetical protein